MRLSRSILGVLTACVLGSALAVRAEPAPTTRKVTVVNVEYEGTKIWLPGTIVVTKGTTIDLTLINNAPSGQHGFSIPAFAVSAVVEKGTPAHLSFVADKEGVFPIICHLHPAHVGGQLVVLP